MNVGQLLTLSANKYAQRTAILFENQRISYREFNERANRWANFLLTRGLPKGEKVAALLYNSPQLAEVYFGTVKAGGVFAPVNFRLAAEEILYLLDHSDARVFVFGEEFCELVERIREKLAKVNFLIVVGKRAPSQTLNYESAIKSSSPMEPEQSVVEQDECQLLYTSGTTGRPKGAVLTHANVLWNLVNGILGREENQEGGVSLVIGPLCHTASLNNHFTIRVALGGTSILMQQFDARTVMEMIEKEKVNVISAAPAVYHFLLNLPDVKRYDTRSVTKCTAGASILPEETKERILQLFPNVRGIYDVYGCTEAAPNITTLRAADSLRKQACVGLPLPFLQVKLVDDQDRDVPLGQIGEVVCQGPNLMKGYYKDPKGTQEALRGGWLHTGDLARMDDEGFIYIVGRKKDMIISGGENIYPREIEEVLYRHPQIQDAAVVGIPDPTWGESVKAFVVLKNGTTLKEEEVIEYCKAHLASYKKPKSVRFVDSLPRNASGKILKRNLKNEFPL